MNNNLTTFINEELGRLRIVDNNGEPWFVGRDVAAILGYSNASKAVMIHVDEEDKRFVMIDIANSQNGNVPTGQSKTAIINESGLYSLILLSKLPTAKEFKHWVTSEVLPSVRKTGTYARATATPELARANAMMLNAKSRIANQMIKLWTAAGIEPQYQALAMNNYYEGLTVPRIAFQKEAMVMFDLTTIAKHLGVMSKSGKPHAQAIGAIVEKLKPLDEGECELTPYSRHGHDDVSMQYSLSVEHKVKAWLEKNDYPSIISGRDKNFAVNYKTA